MIHHRRAAFTIGDMMGRILVVDDDPAQRGTTVALVERAGYEAVAVGSGAEALALLADRPGINAMLLDLVMPDLDGLAVLEALARRGDTVPVIVQASSAAADLVGTALAR